MKGKRLKRPHGELRRSQVVTTYGPGAMLDLPKRSVIISGLDQWNQDGPEVVEPRLLAAVRRIPGLDTVRLRQPAADTGDFFEPKGGIQAWVFPEWFVTQSVIREDKSRGIRSRLLVHRSRLKENRPVFVDADRIPHPVVPVRFVRACRRGHIGDIDWFGYVHQTGSNCRQQLWLDEEGTTGDLSAITIRCSCGQLRRLFEASDTKARALGSCNGYRPWLGQQSNEPCAEPNRLLIRTASNAYFAQTITVISIPEETSEDLKAAVNGKWDHFEDTKTADEIRKELQRTALKRVLGEFDEDQIVAYVLSRHGGGNDRQVRSKEAEFETLSQPRTPIGSNKQGSDFYAEELPKHRWTCPEMSSVDRVLLIHRLKEVTAQVSFTRFESATTDIHGELDAGVQRAALMRSGDWVPAIENRGEGLFLSFSRLAVDQWLARKEVMRRGEELSAGFSNWHNEHAHSKRVWAGLPYVLIHTLSHLLLTSISLNCGYPASAIKERVYAGPYGYGLLLYTGTPDSEGTLGGLVDTGKSIREHFKDALKRAELCSNDPVCATHEPANRHDQRFLQGAACHGCVLVAEPSCEMQNDFLDRALVVPTVANSGAAFFSIG